MATNGKTLLAQAISNVILLWQLEELNRTIEQARALAAQENDNAVRVEG